MTTNRTAKPYPSQVRDRAVRLVREHEAEHASLAAAIRRRRLEPIGTIPPAEAEARFYAREETALAA